VDLHPDESHRCSLCRNRRKRGGPERQLRIRARGPAGAASYQVRAFFRKPPDPVASASTLGAGADAPEEAPFGSFMPPISSSATDLTGRRDAAEDRGPLRGPGARTRYGRRHALTPGAIDARPHPVHWPKRPATTAGAPRAPVLGPWPRLARAAPEAGTRRAAGSAGSARRRSPRRPPRRSPTATPLLEGGRAGARLYSLFSSLTWTAVVAGGPAGRWRRSLRTVVRPWTPPHRILAGVAGALSWRLSRKRVHRLRGTGRLRVQE
jgi:hypothetical protein